MTSLRSTEPRLCKLAALLIWAGFIFGGEMAAQGTPAITPESKKTFSQETYTYKQVGDCAIKATVSRTPGTEIRPAIIWIHGGSLIFGNRNVVSADQVQRYVQAGFVVVAIDYRLAPETKLPAILEDVQDAWRWVREQGPKLFSIDPDQIVLVGHSSGAHLALMAGRLVKPRPKAIVSFYGQGDVLDDFSIQPNLNARKRGLVSKEEADRTIGQATLSESPVPTPRQLFSLYCEQNGLWVKATTGLDPATQAAALEAYCPVRHVTADFPPTIFVHGDKDESFEESVRMVDALKARGVPQQFIRMEGYDHLFDMSFPPAKRPLVTDSKIAAAYDQVVGFLRKHVGH